MLLNTGLTIAGNVTPHYRQNKDLLREDMYDAKDENIKVV